MDRDGIRGEGANRQVDQYDNPCRRVECAPSISKTLLLYSAGQHSIATIAMHSYCQLWTIKVVLLMRRGEHFHHVRDTRIGTTAL